MISFSFFIYILLVGSVALYYYILKDSFNSGLNSLFGGILSEINVKSIFPILFFAIYLITYITYLRSLFDEFSILITWTTSSILLISFFLITQKWIYEHESEILKIEKEIDKESNESFEAYIKSQYSKITSQYSYIKRIRIFQGVLVFVTIILFSTGITEITAVDSYKEAFLNSIEIDFHEEIIEYESASGNHATGREREIEEYSNYYTKYDGLNYFVNDILGVFIAALYIFPFMTILIAAADKSERNEKRKQ